jgi:hypothetical protein
MGKPTLKVMNRSGWAGDGARPTQEEIKTMTNDCTTCPIGKTCEGNPNHEQPMLPPGAYEEAGHQEVMDAIRAKLNAMDDDDKMHFLQEAFDDAFVYEILEGGASQLWQRGYSYADGKVTFGGDPYKVTRKISYETLQANRARHRKSSDNILMPVMFSRRQGGSQGVSDDSPEQPLLPPSIGR